ncbi:MAG: EAL domain-containing protein, partial [Caldilineae bacterium]
GIQTLVKLQEHVPDIPIIVLTGLSDEAMAVEAVRQGAQDYLVKSQIDGRSLARAVRYAIERFRTLEALRESQERYALVARATNDGLWDWDLSTDQVYYSPRWCAMVGTTEEEIQPTPDEWFQRIHPEDRPAVEQALYEHLGRHRPDFEVEYRMRHQEGGYRWMRSRGLALFDANGHPYRIAGSQTDITQRKRVEARLLHDAHHDPLTGLPNRTYFHQQLEQALARRGNGTDAPFAVLFMDMDRFKLVNDSLGHLVGDELLRAFAIRLRNTTPPGSLLARLGGDEFALLLPAISTPEEAVQSAQRILQAMKHPFHVAGQDFYATCSIGITLSSPAYARPEEMLRDADNAMYRAKTLGPGGYQIFDAAMHTRALTLWQLERDLRQALQRGEFRIYFQPIVALESGKLGGFETLVRWKHPQRGLLYPKDFLQVAEEAGILALLDRWMIRQAAHYARRWNRCYANGSPIFFSVNLSDALIREPDFTRFVRAVQAETDLDPRSLKFEITETVIMKDMTTILQALAELRRQNFQLCIDDFGTGYSSLGSLHLYPADTLKIDRSFVQRLCEDNNSQELVRTITTLARDLEMDVVAEGIENLEQARFLHSLGCKYGQGVYFASAIDAHQCDTLLRQKPTWAVKP